MARQAVSYLRVSSRGQIRGEGLARQRERIRRFARKNRIDLVAEFSDRGVSGTKDLAHRKGLAALLERLDDHGVELVLVESADRLARDLMVQEVILHQFGDLGIRVLTASGVDLSDDSDPSKKMVRRMHGIFSEYEKDLTVLKLRWARQKVKEKKGVCEGRKPYGFYEGEAWVLHEIRRLRRKPRGRGKRRMSWDNIARSLNEMGYSTRMGRPWIGATVRRIALRNQPTR